MIWLKGDVFLNVLLQVVLQVLDGLATLYLVKHCGGKEANPLLVYFIENLGLEAGLIIPKTIVIIVLIWLLIFSKEISNFFIKVILLINLLYVLIVGWNILNILACI